MRTSPVWLLFLAILAFGASLFGTLILDDYAIFSDPAITSPSGWLDVWRPAQTRPLTYVTFWINYAIGGKSPVGYHAVNLAFHLAAVWFALGALKLLLPERTAWVAAAIFAVHPLQSEAVNYIFARSTLLMAVFCLLSLRDWLQGRTWRAVAWFGLALLSKEEAVAWPLFLVLLRVPVPKAPIAAMLGLSLAAGARVAFMAAATPGSGAGSQAGIGAWEYFWTQGLVILRYFAMAIVPVLPYRIESPIAVGVYWWAWLALAACAIWAAIHRKKAGVWILGALVLLLPSSSIFPAADLSADRRMYLPLLPVAVFLTLFIPRVHYVLFALAAISAIRTWDWLDAERFWRYQALGGSVRSQVQLAREVELVEAREILERAKNNNPENALVASELGRVYLTAGHPDKALAEFGRALASAPDNPQALSNRGVALILLKQTDAARADFERALAIDPCSFEARLNAKRLGMPLPHAPQCRYSEDERQALSGE